MKDENWKDTGFEGFGVVVFVRMYGSLPSTDLLLLVICGMYIVFVF